MSYYVLLVIVSYDCMYIIMYRHVVRCRITLKLPIILLCFLFEDQTLPTVNYNLLLYSRIFRIYWGSYIHLYYYYVIPIMNNEYAVHCINIYILNSMRSFSSLKNIILYFFTINWTIYSICILFARVKNMFSIE